MTPIHMNDCKLDPKNPSLDDAACRQALATVREELLAIPAAAVKRPDGDERTRPARVLAMVAATPRGDAEIEVRLARLELLARALLWADYERMFAPPCKLVKGYDALVAAAEHAFQDVESLALVLVRRGVLARRDLPRREPRSLGGGTLDGRCRHVCELVEVLLEQDCDPASQDMLRRAESLANRLENARPGVARVVSARELRNRAYTALRTELDAMPGSERSGVFVLVRVDGALTDVRSA